MNVKLILQPEDGVNPLIEAIDGARKSIETAIFRFDHADIQRALERAVSRGVSVHALIANTNRGKEKELRKLEMELLPAGIEVARTADDLLRYHYKFMIIDRQILALLTFNYSYLDIGSRSFGIITRNPDLVREAARLFEADVRRQTYAPELENFLVSPINARQELSRFILGAEKELLIYDPEISDPPMIRLLRERAKSGVEIRIIGRVTKGSTKLGSHGLMRMRFHTRTIVRDRRRAFIGSQSLREAELDRRRELGMILHDRDVVHSLAKIFDRDWATLMPSAEASHEKMEPAARAMKRVAKTVVRNFPLEPLVERALRQAVRDIPDMEFEGHKFEHTLEDAIRQAVEDTVSHIVRETAEAEART
jgi:phosphatidylserine/phosphatidylglycerophosphate/cardiolipin synthase-like enzyme